MPAEPRWSENRWDELLSELDATQKMVHAVDGARTVDDEALAAISENLANAVTLVRTLRATRRATERRHA